MIQESSVYSESFSRICSVELYVFNSETSEQISIARAESTVILQINREYNFLPLVVLECYHHH